MRGTPGAAAGWRPRRAGTFEFTADAPGYIELQLEVVVPAAVPVPGQCCGIPFVAQHRDVGLTRH